MVGRYLIKSTYGNGKYIEYGYDSEDRLKTKKYNGVVDTTSTYTYNALGQVDMFYDGLAKKTTKYNFDFFNWG